MYELFYKYLTLNHKVGLPGMGYFFIETIPSRIDVLHRQFLPPTQTINFKNENLLADRNFFDYICRELKLNETEAITRFNEFSRKLNSDAAGENGAVLNGIGVLKREGDDIIFHSQEDETDILRVLRLSASFVEGLDAQTSRKQKQKPKAAKKENWWIYALILGLAGIGAVLYYYYTAS